MGAWLSMLGFRAKCRHPPRHRDPHDFLRATSVQNAGHRQRCPWLSWVKRGLVSLVLKNQHQLSCSKRIDLLTWFSLFGLFLVGVPKGDHLLLMGPLGK